MDSALSGEENEEAVNRLVALENDASTEIVIHVNKLKEGWDVRNLYTIVPLRASASDILTEQTLGRGLRLPYGERTGNEAVDTLTVIAHDHFDEVIRRAKAAGSIVLTPMEIGENGEIRAGGQIELSSSPIAEQMLTNELGEAAQAAYGVDGEQSAAIAAFVYHVIRGMESELTHIGQLRTPEVQARVTRQVEELIRPVQQTLPGFTTLDVAGIVGMLAAGIVDRMIEIPEIVLSPAGQVTFAFADFDLAGLDTIAPGPVDDGILVENLRTGGRQVIARDPWIVREARLEDHLVSRLLGYNEVDYRTNSDLLYKLAAQMVQHLRSCLASDPDVENVLLNQGEDLAGFIFRQMMEHSRFGETPAEYRAHVARGFRLLQDIRFRVADMSEVRDFRIPVVPPGDTRRYVYTGFSRCLYEYQRFQSDEERRFAVLIDSDREPGVMRWMKPASGQFQIRYRRMKPYEPDFVVETVSERLIVEIKARKDLEDEEVLAKAAGARRWVGHANDHAMTYGGKSWRYALIPHDAVLGNSTLAGLIARFSQTAVPGAAPTV